MNPAAKPLARQHSAASERNSAPILAQLQRLLPASGVMLEVASGTGQHAAAFSAGLPQWRWLPTDAQAQSLSSISAWCEGLPQVAEPLQLDVLAPQWAGVPMGLNAMFCANMLHIAPWACCAGLMQGAARHLGAHGQLITYGPYLEDGLPTAESNAAFDTSLRSRNPQWGLRRREAVEQVAAAAGLRLHERVAMPANNLLLVWRRGT